MGVILAWFTTVVLVLSLFLVLHHLGVDAPPMIAAGLRSVEHLLGAPL